MKKFFTVLGGMGTLATESYVRLLDQRTPIHRDQDYLDYIVVNHASVPDRTAWILDHQKPDYNLDLIEDIKQQSLLKPAFFVLICNTAHYAFDKLQAATDIPILNMLDETVKEIKHVKPSAKKVGLLATRGTVEAGLYDQYITGAGYEEIKPTPEILDMTEDLIYHDIKEAGHSNGQKFHELVRKMVEEEGADVVILGCTELSYAQEMNPEKEFTVVDSQSTIVDRSLELGMKLEGRK
jgi:aspartate racemase